MTLSNADLLGRDSSSAVIGYLTLDVFRDLLIVAVSACLLSLFISRIILPWRYAIPLAVIKICIPFVYFAFLFDGTWLLKDDVTYFRQGVTMNVISDPFSMINDPDARTFLWELSNRGLHVLYGWWNMLLQWIYGPYYFVPVFFNVALTFVAAGFLYAIAILASFDRTYAGALFVFTLLHPDVLAWSSFVNLKDIWVFALTIIMIWSSLSLITERRISAFILFTAAAILLVGLRFYIPMLIVLSVMAWSLINSPPRIRWAIAGIGILCLLVYINMFESVIATGFRTLKFESMGYGLLHFVFTPRPWAVEDNYSFLVIPAIWHWLMFLPSSVGLVLLWRDSVALRLLVIYLLGVTTLYTLLPDYQGPRHRWQVSFVFIWAQFHVLFVSISTWRRAHAKPSHGEQNQLAVPWD